jgi:hypothetical protein
LFDAQTAFVLPNSAFSLVGGAGAIVQIGNIVDLLGVGVGVAPPNIIGNRSVYGVDPGIGLMKNEVEIDLLAALATGNSATAEFAIQYAIDSGASGGYQPGTWEDANTTGIKAVGAFPAGTQIRMDLPPSPADMQLPPPRFVRAIMRPSAAANLNAGTVAFAGIVPARTDLVNKNAPNNYQAL